MAHLLTVKALAWWLWLAMTAWVPTAQQTAAWREPEDVAAGRYLDFAEGVARAALDPDVAPLPGLSTDAEGDDEARARTALLVAAVGSYESLFVARVVDCRILGPGGAVGPFQTHRHKDLACRSVRDAAVVAIDMLRESMRVCARLPLLDRAGLYTDGACRSGWARSRVRDGRAVTWWTARPRAWAEGLREGWADWD